MSSGVATGSLVVDRQSQPLKVTYSHLKSSSSDFQRSALVVVGCSVMAYPKELYTPGVLDSA